MGATRDAGHVIDAGSTPQLRGLCNHGADMPVLVLGIGNPSRGDDALGPRLIERLQVWQQTGRLPGVTLETDFQLQPEHVLDLVGRRRVIIVDAALALETPYCLKTAAPGTLHEVAASWTTHHLTPAALLALYRSLYGEPPRLELLAIGARAFELGAGLSAPAAANLAAALERLCCELETGASSALRAQGNGRAS